MKFSCRNIKGGFYHCGRGAYLLSSIGKNLHTNGRAPKNPSSGRCGSRSDSSFGASWLIGIRKGSPVRPLQPPPIEHPVLMNHSRPPKSGSCCCKCICWTISLLVLLLVIVGATAGILYLVFQPKLPSYSVDSLNISSLGLNIDMSLYAEFDVKITAYNPNKKIGIYYEKGGRLSVWYSNTKLCDGALPEFYQGHQNKTVLHLALTGQTQYGSTLMNAIQEQQQTGRIPLDLKVDAPVAIKLGMMKLKKVRILGECLLVVDSLSANNSISIKASNCRLRLKL